MYLLFSLILVPKEQWKIIFFEEVLYNTSSVPLLNSIACFQGQDMHKKAP